MESTSAPSFHLDTLSHDNHFLKMEDIDNCTSPLSSSSPAPTPSVDSSVYQQSPAPIMVHSKPAKKRKSWGQELPEPKTSLPPRKRAKTDDEKEQRRIERIKRNRAAAHNSRERKRQEAEGLAVQLARANAELEAYRRLHGPLPSSVVLPEVHLSTGTEYAETASTPAPSLVESHGSVKDDTTPSSPPEDIFHNKTPYIKQESFDGSFSTVPSAFDNDSKSSVTLSPLDLTQHSAAMLCDLQCRSSSLSSNSTTWETTWWARLILTLMSTHFQTCYKTLLVALWTISPSRMARMMQASKARSSRLNSSLTTTQLSRSTRGRLARLNAATGLSGPREGTTTSPVLLKRQSLEHVRKARHELAARQAQGHENQRALLERIRENQEGDEGNGVRNKDTA